MSGDRPVAILVAALGGEGGGVLAEWLVDVAARTGLAAQSTSIPGVAQRTGATTYYVEIFPVPIAALGGRTPVFSLSPVPGAIDLLVASELLECARQIAAGMATPARTHVIASTSRSLTTAEKMAPGDGRADDGELLALVRAESREAQVFDVAALAREHGTAISAVLFGAIAASGALPLEGDVLRAACEATIRDGGKGVAASLAGFAAAHARITTLRAERRALDAALDGAARSLASDGATGQDAQSGTAAGNDTSGERQGDVPRASPRPKTRDADVTARIAGWPETVRDIVLLGHARLVDYQGAAYARLYLDRLTRVVGAERRARQDAAALASTSAASPRDDALNALPAARAVARWLALWMAFDDIVRVADLKTRAARFARVEREVHAGERDVVRIVDHFKPGAAEAASLLPRRLADALLRVDARRRGAGKTPLAWPMKLRTDTVAGFALLRVLAAARRLRPFGSRYAAEQAAIERWLNAVVAALARHARLGVEIAECGRLVKGYGATNERGKEHLGHVVDYLALSPRFGDDDDARADAIRAARVAALADDSGAALDRALAQHGAPPRPVRAQPIRWVKARPGG